LVASRSSWIGWSVSDTLAVEMKMPIFAKNDVMLDRFAYILHDLHVSLGEVKRIHEAGILRLDFMDSWHELQRRVVTRFRLTIKSVKRTEILGKFEKCPDPIQFNKFKFKARNSTLTLEFVHPVKLVLTVSELDLELEQLS
jgi:hypothetical protein